MDRALPFIERAARDDAPFFAVIWFHAPHEPVRAGPRHRAMYSEFSEGEQHFYGCITALDEQVGRLRAELRRLGVAGETMLWYCSDNGPEGRGRREGNRRGSAGPLRGRKRSLFEGGVRVPGILEWPAEIRPGQSTSVPCSTLDYLPTTAVVSGLEVERPNEPIDGVNLLPLLSGEVDERPEPIAFQTPDGGEKGADQRFGSPNHALIDNRYKFLSYLDEARADQDLLFDLSVDPGERYNILEKAPEIAAKMKTRLQAWKQSCNQSESRDHAGPTQPRP